MFEGRVIHVITGTPGVDVDNNFTVGIVATDPHITHFINPATPDDNPPGWPVLAFPYEVYEVAVRLFPAADGALPYIATVMWTPWQDQANDAAIQRPGDVFAWSDWGARE